MKEDNIKDPKGMTTQALLQELKQFHLVYRDDDRVTVHCEMMLSEVTRRIGLLDDFANEVARLKMEAPAPRSPRSIELVLNDLVNIQHPEPMDLLQQQVSLLNQTIRLLDVENYSNVISKLRAMRCFNDPLEFRHALMNMLVLLTITDRGDVSVTYRGRQMYPGNMMMGSAPSVFGPGPYFNGAGGMEPGVINQPYRGRNGNLKPLITLPITALFSLKATDGDNGFKTITVVDGLMPDVVYPPQAAGPVEILSSLIEQNGNNRYLIEVMERVHKGEVVAEIDIFARGFAPTLRVSPNTY